MASPYQSQLNAFKAAISQTTKQKHNAHAETEHETQNKEIAEFSKREGPFTDMRQNCSIESYIL